ncbi:MAG: hypothetical protein KY391_04320, partial [Actinobacteria bacterium]|nr:hypothetical protein [Actinomycetota bacterium]
MGLRVSFRRDIQGFRVATRPTIAHDKRPFRTRAGAASKVPSGYFGQYVTIAIFTFAGALIVFGTIG